MSFKSGSSIALCFEWHLKCCTSSSSRFLIFLLIILYTVFAIFPLPSVSPNIRSFFHRTWAVHYMSKIFQCANCGQIFQRVLGHNLVSHWCIHPSYSPWYHQSFFICFPLHPYTFLARHIPGETVVCSGLTFVFVETSKSFMIFVQFAIAGLLKLILFLVSSLV